MARAAVVTSVRPARLVLFFFQPRHRPSPLCRSRATTPCPSRRIPDHAPPHCSPLRHRDGPPQQVHLWRGRHSREAAGVSPRRTVERKATQHLHRPAPPEETPTNLHLQICTNVPCVLPPFIDSIWH